MAMSVCNVIHTETYEAGIPKAGMFVVFSVHALRIKRNKKETFHVSDTGIVHMDRLM